MRSHPRNIALLAVVLALTLSVSWVGLMFSDDVLYAAGAMAWLDQPFPHVGETHWSLRHPFVLPVAASFALFGEQELSLVFVTTAYFILIVLLTYRLIADCFGPGRALFAGILLILTPLFAVNATIAGADLTELFFVLLALWLFQTATKDGVHSSLLFASGVAMGLAWWTRETTAGLLVLFFLLFLLGYRVPRRHYWIIAGGFLLMVASEWLYYHLLTGDMWYRIAVDRDQGATFLSQRGQPHLAGNPGTGNLEVTTWLNPVLTLLVNQEFGLLFYLAVPASIWAWRGRAFSEEQRHLARLFVGLGVVWFVTIGYIIPVRDLPRYYSVTAHAAVVLTALWLAHLFGRSVKIAVLLTGMLVGLAVLALLVENTMPVFGDRAYVTWTAQAKERVYTDLLTYGRTSFLRKAAGVNDRVGEGVPPPGGLFFHNPNRVELADDPAFRSRHTPKSDWIEVARIEPKRMFIGRMLEWLRVDRVLPPRIVKRLNTPVDAVAVYRIPGPRSMDGKSAK